MIKLLTLYFGVMILMKQSMKYYPVEAGGDGIDLTAKKGQHFMHCKTDIYMAIAMIWLTCFMFLRTSYNDTTAYINMFYGAETPMAFLASGKLFDLTGNPLFYFYQSFMRSVTNNYHIYFLFPALLISITSVKFIKSYANHPVFSASIFFSIGTVITMMVAMKQGIAIAILLISIPHMLNKNYKAFYGFVFLASLFHAYAFVFAILPLLCNKPWAQRTWLLLIATLIVLFTFDKTVGAFVDYADSIGMHAASEDVFNGASVNIIRVVIYLVPTIISLIFRERLFRSYTKTEALFVNMSILSSFIMALGIADGANMLARAAAFFEIGYVISLPWMIGRLFTQKSFKSIAVIIGFFYFLLFMFDFGVVKDFNNAYNSISFFDFILQLLGV